MDTLAASGVIIMSGSSKNPAGRQQAMSNSAVTICMIDDDENDIFLAQRFFSRQTPSVNFVARSDAGVIYDNLETLKSNETQTSAYPDFILLDLNMPRADGLSILRRLKTHETLKRIPVFIFSTSEAQEHVESAYDSGASAYISKPHSVDEYSRLARAFVGFWGDVARRPEPIMRWRGEPQANRLAARC
jgi:CheY-like chemotaxis protein